MMPNDLKKIGKSFWDTKEGVTGALVGCGIFAGLGYGAYKIMPYLANLMENTFYFLGFLALSVFLFYALVLDSMLRNRCWLVYKLLMHKLTYAIIKYDPFGVLREMQERARERNAEVDKQRKEVKAQSTTIRQELEGFKSEQQTVRSNVQWMQEQGKSREVIADEVSKIAILEESIQRLSKSFSVTDGFYQQMTRIYEELDRLDKKIGWEINLREREYKAINATNSAMQIMQAVLKGTDANSKMRDETLAYLAQDYGEKLGRIESAMEDSSKFLEHADMQNAMYADKGMKLLEDLKGRDISVGLIGSSAKVPVSSFKIK